MKIKYMLLTIALISSQFMTSCKKESTSAKPVIELTELGYENSKIAYAGSDLHIEADIVAEGKIQSVRVQIHPETDHQKTGNLLSMEGAWEVDTTYTEFAGLKNTTFHKHLEVAATADTGHYHLHFIVTDQEGQQTTLEEDLEIKKPDDSAAPVITISSAPSAGQVFENGSIISISGTVSDDQALGEIYIALVREGQNIPDADVEEDNTITLLHQHDFENTPSYNFSASITIGAAKDNNHEPKPITGDLAWQSGNYYLLVKSEDAFGGNLAISARYPVIIHY